jgi:WhiB family redox-sensing transcriptional regulator
VSHHVYPDTLTRDNEWLVHAVCKADPDAMHPDNNEAGIAYAKKICGRCPVRAECLRDAFQTGDNDYGIRAGLRPRQRAAIAARLKPEQLRDWVAIAAAARQVLNPNRPDESGWV